jgi:hypothetical protein
MQMAGKKEPTTTTGSDTKGGVRGKGGHRATYATDKRTGGYLIRIVGPHSNAFAGREVPVLLRSGETQKETLEKVIWTGKDQESGEPVTLYKFKAKPREQSEMIEF